MSASFGAGDFRQACRVSRETLTKLERYAALLRRWQPAINLVAESTLDDLWRRHFLDSAQLIAASGAGADTVWLDIGSGAGFPGLVVALCGGGTVHLVESDQRKAAFLREVIRETGAPAVLHPGRIESLAPFAVDVITARACAPLTRLLHHAAPFRRPQTRCIFLKGQSVDTELTEATKYWKISYRTLPSKTAPGGCILLISDWQQRPGA